MPKFPKKLHKIIIFAVLLIWLKIDIIKCNQKDSQSSELESTEEIENSELFTFTESAYYVEFRVKDPTKYELLNVTCKSLLKDEPHNNSCENLAPCTRYLAQIKLKQLNVDSSTIDRTEEVQTKYIEPKTEISSIDTYSLSVKLNWTVTDRTCISNFEIEIRAEGKEFKWTKPNNEYYLLIENLNPCQEYKIQLKTFDVNRSLISNETAEGVTKYAEPGDLKINFTKIENTQVKLSWALPENATCIEFYHIRWFIRRCQNPEPEVDPESQIEETNIATLTESQIKETNIATLNEKEIENNHCEWSTNLTDWTIREYIISELRGCESYNVEFYINNQEKRKGHVRFTSREQLPSLVAIKEITVNRTIATITWHRPELHAKCVDEYQLHIVGPLQRPIDEQNSLNVTSVKTTLKIVLLEPCGSYNLSISSRSLNGSITLATNDTFSMNNDEPSQVVDLKFTLSRNMVSLTWKPPIYAELCVTDYRLAGWNEEKYPFPAFQVFTSNLTVTIKDLYSCDAYLVHINANTKELPGKILEFGINTMPVTASAPKLQVIGVSSNHIEIKAHRNNPTNKCDIIFAEITCKATTNVTHQIIRKFVHGNIATSYSVWMDPLSPFTEYKCGVSFYNAAGWSLLQSITRRTESYYPDKPEKIGLILASNESLTFNWLRPRFANGNINLYIIYFQYDNAAYYVPPGCPDLSVEIAMRETSSLEQTFSNLLPYSRYSIQVAAKNEVGVGLYTNSLVVSTKPWISEPITNFQITTKGPLGNTLNYSAYLEINWHSPCRSNGIIEYFFLQFEGDNDLESHGLERQIKAPTNTHGLIHYTERNIKPEFKYIVKVAVKTKDVSTFSPSSWLRVKTPAGIPRSVEPSILNKIRIDDQQYDSPAYTATIRIPYNITSNESGKIIFMAILIAQKNCKTNSPKFDAIDTYLKWPSVASWNDVYANLSENCISQYQTTPLRWAPIPFRDKSSTKDEIVYVIGADNCLNSMSGRYCNGPLLPETDYNIVLRLFTSNGYNDVAFLQLTTEPLIELNVIIISVSICLLTALVVGFVYIFIKKRLEWKREARRGLESGFGDIISKTFGIYYDDIVKPDKVAREFKELNLVALDLSCSASPMGHQKNRYANIYPYDKNRVILDIDAEGSDYINASFIDGYKRRKEYIATQSPQVESVYDFWRMILQYNVRVVVMVAQFQENNVKKCHKYFPFQSRGIDVTVKKSDSYENYTRTELLVGYETFVLRQKVVHLQFTQWPENLCPDEPIKLINFIKKVKSERNTSYSPTVVHCCAGVGRTGTYIALDIIQQRLRNESKINVYETVKKLRFQRMKMIQTLAQYTFLYNCAYAMVVLKYGKRLEKKRIPRKFSKKPSSIISPEDRVIPSISVSSLPAFSTSNDRERSFSSIQNYHVPRNNSDLTPLNEHEVIEFSCGNQKSANTSTATAEVYPCRSFEQEEETSSEVANSPIEIKIKANYFIESDCNKTSTNQSELNSTITESETDKIETSESNRMSKAIIDSNSKDNNSETKEGEVKFQKVSKNEESNNENVSETIQSQSEPEASEVPSKITNLDN